jgi:hypothetical protein
MFYNIRNINIFNNLKIFECFTAGYIVIEHEGSVNCGQYYS